MLQELRQIVDDSIDKSLEELVKKIGASKSSIMFIGELVEGLYKNGNFGAGENFRPVLDVLIPKLLESIKPKENKLEEIPFIEAVEFSGAFYSLRDLIYISFAAPSSIEFTGDKNNIKISVKDATIFRQIVCEVQAFSLNSKCNDERTLNLDEIVSLLSGTNSWDSNDPNVAKVLASIEMETDWKIKHYFSHIPENSCIDLGGYLYSEFISIYKQLLYISLYERYYSKANNLSCVITYDEKQLINALKENTGIDVSKCEKILRDIASSSRGTFNYFYSDNTYYLFPFSFSLKDGINAILKQYAQKDSDAFSAHCAGVIGDSLVSKVSGYFDSFKNFCVFKEILLQGYSKDLPDIDCLIVSYEPSLGFHFFVCEVKNNLPASWAKEYLKAAGKKGFIEKALSQSGKILDFLKTDDGAELLRQKAMQAFPQLDMKALFPTGFCGVIDCVIVTSQSIGMFFPEITTTIIADDMLRQIVSKCDGDVNFIRHHLRHLNENLDSCYSVATETINASGVKITYPTCQLIGFLEISQNKYLSNGSFESIENESLRTGYRFIDSISA